MLEIQGERSRPRILYLDGELQLMSPGPLHETLAELIGLFVVEVAYGLGVAFTSAGSTTYRDQPKEGGIEPDKSFYIATHPRLREKKKMDLSVDPPPDLVIEVVNTHPADNAVEVCRRFGVAEVWVCDEQSLRILRLGEEGSYSEFDTSRWFPTLTALEIHQWATRDEDPDSLTWLRAVRSWVEEVLAARTRDPREV